MDKILIVEDDLSVRDMLGEFFVDKGFDTVCVEDGASSIEKVNGEKFGVILLDMVLPDTDGLTILKEIKKVEHCPPVIAMTAFGSVESAVSALKLGAFDYIIKPFNLEELYILAKNASKLSTLEDENIQLKKQLKRKYDFPMLIGKSSEMEGIYSLIGKVSDTDATVMITGESGTGKERVARTIHFNSERAERPFIPVNCAAIPETLLESELFGHEKGSFTGAINTRVGRFELAHGGTIFLDEIAELHPQLQVKLLRVLQEKEFERVGGLKTHKVDVRILAATNRDIDKATKDGSFREDLYYRLNVIPMHIPALRQRKDDIPLFIDYFLKYFTEKRQSKQIRLSMDVKSALLRYAWPGNIRELENLMERIVILSESDVVTMEDLPERFKAGLTKPDDASAPHVDYMDLPAEGVDLNAVLDNIERKFIKTAMKRAGGVKTRAASMLGLNRTTLIEKIKKKSIELE